MNESLISHAKRPLSYKTTEMVTEGLGKFAWAAFAKSVSLPFCHENMVIQMTE